VRAAFLSAYDGAGDAAARGAAARGAAPRGTVARGAVARGAALYDALQPGQGLLGLFELEKALYELRYELGNRPSWVGIPLQGILDWSGG
jgi:predicted trehalose synthase